MDICVHHELIACTGDRMIEYPEELKTCERLWTMIGKLDIEIAPGAHDIIADIQRERRALKLQLTLCERQQFDKEQELVADAENSLLTM